MMLLVLIIYFEINLSLIRAKLLKERRKKSLLEVKLSDYIYLAVPIGLLTLLEFKFLTCYLVFRFFDFVLSINLRLVILNIYYDFFFEKNSKKYYICIIDPDSIIRKIFNKNSSYIFISIIILWFDFRIWVLYWILSEFVDVIGGQISSDFDQALFGKAEGYDIVVTPSGVLKLQAYKIYLLDNKISLRECFIYEGIKVGNYDHFLKFDFFFDDFFYKDPKIQFLATLDCL